MDSGSLIQSSVTEDVFREDNPASYAENTSEVVVELGISNSLDSIRQVKCRVNSLDSLTGLLTGHSSSVATATI